MQTQYVRVVCDVICTPGSTPVRYRAYVNDELFAERTWIWEDSYLEESLQIQAPPGKYTVRYELVDDTESKFKVKNMRIDEGNATMKKNILEILP